MNLQRREDFLTYSAGFLLVMLIITMGLAVAARLRPLLEIHWSIRDFAVGVGAALAMMAVFGWIRPVRRQAEEILGPSLAACRWHDLIWLAALVGLIEELLFRGVIEPWMARWDPWVALVATNVLFGLLHSVSRSYAVVAMLLGAILSGLAHGLTEFNLLRPIVAHAVYDYIGFVWIAASFRRQHPPGTLPETPHSEEQHVD